MLWFCVYRILSVESSPKLLKDISDDQIARFYEFIKVQGLYNNNEFQLLICLLCVGANYGVRVKDNTNYAASFFRSIRDKTKLVDPVKDRGNANFKQLRFKAAIADYSTAIKLR